MRIEQLKKIFEFNYTGLICTGIRDSLDRFCIRRRSYHYGWILVEEELRLGRWNNTPEIEAKIRAATGKGLMRGDVERGYLEALFDFKSSQRWSDKDDPKVNDTVGQFRPSTPEV